VSSTFRDAVCFKLSLRNILTLVELYSPNKCVKNHIIRASGIIHGVHVNAKVKDTFCFFSLSLSSSYITGFVHVWKLSCDGHVSDGLFEERLFNGGWTNWT